MSECLLRAGSHQTADQSVFCEASNHDLPSSATKHRTKFVSYIFSYVPLTSIRSLPQEKEKCTHPSGPQNHKPWQAHMRSQKQHKPAVRTKRSKHTPTRSRSDKKQKFCSQTCKTHTLFRYCKYTAVHMHPPTSPIALNATTCTQTRSQKSKDFLLLPVVLASHTELTIEFKLRLINSDYMIVCVEFEECVLSNSFVELSVSFGSFCCRFSLCFNASL